MTQQLYRVSSAKIHIATLENLRSEADSETQLEGNILSDFRLLASEVAWQTFHLVAPLKEFLLGSRSDQRVISWLSFAWMRKRMFGWIPISSSATVRRGEVNPSEILEAELRIRRLLKSYPRVMQLIS